MHKKIVWLLVSGLLVAALVLASCGPAVTEEEEEEVITEEEEEVAEEEEEEGPEMIELRLTKLDGTVVEKTLEKPKYGGTLTTRVSMEPLYFDGIMGHPYYARSQALTNEELLIGDWTRGSIGTGEASWRYNIIMDDMPPQLTAGGLAESWEMLDANTLVYHIRKGVYWHDKPPTNGREMTADDVVFSLNRAWTTPTSVLTTGTYAIPLSITATDKWTVEIKTVAGRAAETHKMSATHAHIVPREAVEMFGNLADWKNAVGTGPFILTDYVRGSSLTYQRNPNYWRKDPFLPDNTLPYIDHLKQLIIPDASTRLAALRTAKLDHLAGLSWEDAEALNVTNPELKWVEFTSGGASAIQFRIDVAPYDDINVRRALFMAINTLEIAETYYGGHAEILNWPVANIPEFKDLYIPLDQMPQSVKELFTYNPDKAKQLLAEAGYPNGFQVEIVLTASQADLLSIVKDFWAKIGVEVTLDVKETGAYTSMRVGRTFDDMFYYSLNPTIPFAMVHLQSKAAANLGRVNDPKIDDAYISIQANYFDWDFKVKTYNEIYIYQLEQAYFPLLPAPNSFTFWQPWVKGYNGESQVGYLTAIGGWPKWVWIDQDLKEEMTGQR